MLQIEGHCYPICMTKNDLANVQGGSLNISLQEEGETAAKEAFFAKRRLGGGGGEKSATSKIKMATFTSTRYSVNLCLHRSAFFGLMM